MRTVKNITTFLVHIYGGKLYKVTITGHEEYAFLAIAKGENPLIHKSSLTFLV